MWSIDNAKNIKRGFSAMKIGSLEESDIHRLQSVSGAMRKFGPKRKKSVRIKIWEDEGKYMAVISRVSTSLRQINWTRCRRWDILIRRRVRVS